MTQWDIRLPWVKPPLSLNDTEHWAPRARKVKEIRRTTMLLAKRARIPHLETCEVRLLWLVSNRRKRDRGNMQATMKPAVDGLVDAGVIEDDAWWIVTREENAIMLVEKGKEGLYLQVLGDS